MAKIETSMQSYIHILGILASLSQLTLLFNFQKIKGLVILAYGNCMGLPNTGAFNQIALLVVIKFSWCLLLLKLLPAENIEVV